MRTEEEILKDFEELGYKISFYHKKLLYLIKIEDCGYIFINREEKRYLLSEFAEITMKEHKLLHELFECWGWL